MTAATLTIDLDAIAANWRALDAKTNVETAAVVKANGYGCGVDRVARRLAREGARRFFVAVAEEGAELRQALGPGPEINVFSGHMPGDTDMIGDLGLVPMINSLDQMLRHLEALPDAPFGIQLDTGMNRLGMEPAEWAALREIATGQNMTLIMSHLACADDPVHPMNPHQLAMFREMTDGMAVPRSLAATGGILMGPEYHFEVTRPGVGLYGGQPFDAAQPVAHVSVPVIQIRDVDAGETVGYGNTWTAREPARIATIAAGYADGIIRAMGPQAHVWVGGTACKMVGRVSMDLIGVDVTCVEPEPQAVELLGHHNTVDVLADAAGTIGYEILTALGGRYHRRYYET
ncbi:alanine racemase [Lacimonas salitolerans]|uniref:Alanine racemase n=1 Tax=Lacimonas salitolerans TaxID=1323750 RepID=A0ABW4EH88_9RHOB